MKVEFFERIFQTKQPLVDLNQFVRLSKNKSTPNAICSILCKLYKFFITYILFLPRNSDFMLLTPYKLSISLILFEPSSSISSSGKSKFSIFIQKVLLFLFCCLADIIFLIFSNVICFRSFWCCYRTNQAAKDDSTFKVLQFWGFCCRKVRAKLNLAKGQALNKMLLTSDDLNQVVPKIKKLKIFRFQLIFCDFSQPATDEIGILNLNSRRTYSA